ncbi:MAG: hypothetical protein QM773_10920 [Hyphomonadaceae bacterium]
MRRIISGVAIVALGVALAGCSGKSGGGGAAAAADATLASFTGEWKVTAHIVAPWFTGPGFDPEPDAEILEKVLTITEKATSGPAILTCELATFDLKSLPVAGLFEGNVPDPYIAKAALGVGQDETPTLMEGCTSGGSDKEMNYHLIGKDKMLLGLDNIVYQFERPSAQTPAQAARPAAAAPVAPPAPAEAPKPH